MKKYEKGFTFIEMMLATAIFAIAVLGLARGFSFFAANSNRVGKQNEVIGEINTVLYNISHDIRMAKAPADGIDPVEVEDWGRLLRIYKNEGDGRMRQVVYRLLDGNLIREWNVSNNSTEPYSFSPAAGQNQKVLLHNVGSTEIFVDQSEENSGNVKKIRIEIAVNDYCESGIQETSAMTVISRSR